MTKKKIILHGHLAEKYPYAIEVEAVSVAEALRSLNTIDELKPENGAPWPITVQGVTTEIALYAETSLSEIHVHPQIGGTKDSGMLQVILGITMIALAAINPTFLGALNISRTSLFLTGGLMLTGGILQMMLPTPQGHEDSESSKYLGASANTVQIGTRIPIAYGNNLLGGHYLSFDVDAVDWSGEDDEPGVTDLVGENVFVEHDKTPVEIVPVNPVFSAPVASPTNIPVSGWSA